jgi:hypothetical protein
MKLYLDEDTASALLADLLRKAGHDVASPVDAGLLGRSDTVQLTHALLDERVSLSRNYEDFEELHVLVRHAQGQHQGILIVRRENDATRDMSAKGIVAAIRKLETAGLMLANEYVVLNQWR